MLIIAIPKSASTSLMETLGRVRNMPAKQIMHKELHRPRQMNLLYKYHSDIREYSQKLIQTFVTPGKIYKQHIPPTENNLYLLRDLKKVVLLRDPKEIIEAYWRGERVGVSDKKNEFTHCKSLDDWLNEAAQNGLLEDLQFFKDGWLAEPNHRICYIHYQDLIKDAKGVINKIETFWGLPRTQESIDLSKKRYSRYHPLRYCFQRIKKKINLFWKYHIIQ